MIIGVFSSVSLRGCALRIRNNEKILTTTAPSDLQ
jgi:hypothetical protein